MASLIWSHILSENRKRYYLTILFTHVTLTLVNNPAFLGSFTPQASSKFKIEMHRNQHIGWANTTLVAKKNPVCLFTRRVKVKGIITSQPRVVPRVSENGGMGTRCNTSLHITLRNIHTSFKATLKWQCTYSCTIHGPGKRPFPFIGTMLRTWLRASQP
jgi:hypothetical protein